MGASDAYELREIVFFVSIMNSKTEKQVIVDFTGLRHVVNRGLLLLPQEPYPS